MVSALAAQHDFGYRNYGRHGSTQLRLSPTPETKAWIDERFWHAMRHACITTHPEGSTARNLCLGEAKVMYDGLSAGIGKGSLLGRARVEHVFARTKNWKILRDCRQKGDGLHHAVQAVATMHNLAMAG